MICSLAFSCVSDACFLAVCQAYFGLIDDFACCLKGDGHEARGGSNGRAGGVGESPALWTGREPISAWCRQTPTQASFLLSMGPDRHPYYSPPLGRPPAGFPSPPLSGSGTIEPSLLQQQGVRIQPGPLPPPPPSHSSSSTSTASSTQGWPPTPLEHMNAPSSSSTSTRLSRPVMSTSQSFPPPAGAVSSSASSSTATIRPRAGKERSASFLGHVHPPVSHKAKPKPNQPPSVASAPTLRKKRTQDGASSTAPPPPKVAPARKDGSGRTQYSSCGACRLRRVR